MSTIATILICQVVMLAIVLGLLLTQIDGIGQGLEKQIRLAGDRLDRVLERNWKEEDRAPGEQTLFLQGKMIPANAPVTIEYIRDVIRSNGYEPKTPDLERCPTDVMFLVNDLIFRVNTNRLPYLALELGFAFDVKNMDLDLLYKSAREISDSMFVVKVSVREDTGVLLFQAEAYFDTVAYLFNNFRLLLNLTVEASERHRLSYDRMRVESAKAVEDIISSAFHKGAPNGQSPN